jgi:tetratricopeptide (TPR) repeat protein
MDSVNNVDKTPAFRQKPPLWRQFEDASPQERERMVDWNVVWESSDGSTIAVRERDEVRLYGTQVTMEFFNGFTSLDSGEWKKIIKHNDKWIRLRKSFNDSKEWHQFRLQWLQTHPACVRCGRTDGVLQVHHAGEYSLDSTVMEEGFLEGLEHPERFETLCVKCHYQEHMPLILNESVVGVKNTEISTPKPLKQQRGVKEKEKPLLISSDKQARQLIKEGFDYAKIHRCEDAITSFDKALALTPEDAFAWNIRGIILRELGRYAESRISFEKAIAISPKTAPGWKIKGDALMSMDQYDDAVASYDRALALKPDYASAWKKRGNALSMLDRNSESISSYDHAIAINPSDTEAWNKRGSTLFGLGRYEDSIVSCDKAIAIDLKNTEAWFHRGVGLVKLGKLEEAIDSFDRVIAIDPNDTLTWNARGNVLSKLGRFLDALESYEKAIAISPNFVFAWHNHGDALSALGQYAKAVESYDRALNISQHCIGARKNREIALKKIT